MKSSINRPMATLAAGLATLISLSSGGCNGTETSSVAGPIRFSSGVERLHSWLCGSFDSSAQAARDSAFRSISLNASSIWPDREDGRWLYVEQAASDSLDRPYRQRIYRVRNDAQGGLISEVFAFNDGETPPAGSWRNPEYFNSIDPALLIPREGCAVHLVATNRDEPAFTGGTIGDGCASTLSGADHATSEVRVEADAIQSWDRGFNASGTQVWGAESGPYEFIRIVTKN
ncbi:chromophore lyase CpcT/CpeT [Phycisphaerales bacterium]|nr:chromophore lyase CpcT/CpeT [Phycisphaerales bacterium]